MKVVSFDLECSNLNADFGIILAGCMLTWTEKKPKRSDVIVYRIDDYKSYETRKWDDRQLVKDIRDELDDADILVSWNGRRFDIPFLNGRLMAWNEKTLKPHKHCDIMYQSRYKMKLHSSRLAAVQSFLGLEDEKTEMKPKMWMKAVTGDKQSMNYIIDHCIRDVLVLNEAYEKLKHFVTNVHT